MSDKGVVYLVGAGPGDPGLITVKGLKCIGRAEVVVYDRLVNPLLLTAAREGAELIYVGKSAHHHALPQEEINALLVRKAREGKTVTRLKGGDPFLFGRGGEEAEALAQADIPFEVVPGVTSAIAAPAYAGIPVTHRDYTSTFAVVTGHEDPTKASDIEWAKIATGAGTLVFLMGVGNLPLIVGELLKHGRPPDTPVAIVRWGTEGRQQTVTGSLQDIVDRAKEAEIMPPAVIVVGEVVSLRDRLRWFDTKPLFGKQVLVTRSREQASILSGRLRELGAEPVEFPTIRTAPPQDFGPLDEAIESLPSYDWVIFTSVNGVKSFMQGLLVKGQDVRALAGVKLAAIGPATAGELEGLSLRVDYLPQRYVAEAIAEGIGDVAGARILLPRADLARPSLVQGLEAKGAVVDEVIAYRTLPGEPSAEIKRIVLDGKIDIVTFTSSSTVHNLVSALEAEVGAGWRTALGKAAIACIGPITARTAQELGIEVDVVAQEHTIEGLVEAIVN
ncbi:MAG: uroporphyrinogen-III C-methyltransferase, partial [Anaerolineae bacterium]